jgi:hypothetical protein
LNIKHLKKGGIVQLECGTILPIRYSETHGLYTAHTGAYMGRMFWNERGYFLDSPTDTVEGYSRYNVREVVEVDE